MPMTSCVDCGQVELPHMEPPRTAGGTYNPEAGRYTGFIPTDNRNVFVCPACADNYDSCEHSICRRVARDEDLIRTDRDHSTFTGRYSGYSARFGAMYCVYCIRTCYMSECAWCDNYGTLRELSGEIDDATLCAYCAEPYSECEGCGWLHDDGGEYCRTCAYDLDYDPELIHSYSYSPGWNKHGDGRVYMGFELETDVPDMERSAEYVHSVAGDIVVMKQDCSIDHGFEIVSHPMTLKYALDSFPWELLDGLDAMGCHADNNGLHIHVNRDAFDSPAHIFRWLKFIYRNERALVRFADRRSYDYADFNGNMRRRAGTHAKGDRSCDRFSAVNVSNHATFELRIWRGTLSVLRVQSALAFVAASVEYTRELTVPAILGGGWQWQGLIEWANGQDDYAAFITDVNERSLALTE